MTVKNLLNFWSVKLSCHLLNKLIKVINLHTTLHGEWEYLFFHRTSHFASIFSLDDQQLSRHWILNDSCSRPVVLYTLEVYMRRLNDWKTTVLVITLHGGLTSIFYDLLSINRVSLNVMYCSFCTCTVSLIVRLYIVQ